MGRHAIAELERSIIDLVDELRAAASQAREAAEFAHAAARQLSEAAALRSKEGAECADD